MSTKELYERAIDTVEEERLSLTADAIRAHVAEQDRRRSELVAENFALEKSRAQAFIQRDALQAKVAELERERDTWEMTALDIQERLDALRARIEGSPKVWLCYTNTGSDLELYNAFDCEENPCEGSKTSRAIRVHAVPVEDDKQGGEG